MFFIFFLFMELLLPFSAFHVHLSKVLKPFLSTHNLELKEGHVYRGRQYIMRHFENDNEFNIILQISFQFQLNHPCFKVWIWVTLNTKNGTKNPLELRVKESVLPWFFREQGHAYWILQAQAKKLLEVFNPKEVHMSSLTYFPSSQKSSNHELKKAYLV